MRACNKCKADVSGDVLGFEGYFVDWGYELDLCVDCSIQFKRWVEDFCNTKIDTSTELSEEERAEREPVSKAYKQLMKKKESMKNVVGFKSSV